MVSDRARVGYVDRDGVSMTDQKRWLGVWIAAIAFGFLGCDQSDNVAGPSPTPTPIARPLEGTWTGSFEGEAPLVECLQPGGTGTASAVLHEAGSSVTGTLSWHQGACNVDGASLQATRVGDTLSGTATYRGATDTVSGTVSSTELVLTVTRGSFPGGTATLHQP